MVLSSNPTLAVLTVELFDRDLRDPETSDAFWKAWHKRADKMMNNRYQFCLTAKDKNSEMSLMDVRAWCAARGNEAVAHHQESSAASSAGTPNSPHNSDGVPNSPRSANADGAFGAQAILNMAQDVGGRGWEALNKTWESIVTFEYRLGDYGLKGTPRFMGASRFQIGSFTSSWNLFWNAGLDGRGAAAGRHVEGAGVTEMYFSAAVPEFANQHSDALMHEFWLLRLPQTREGSDMGEESKFETQSLMTWDQDRVGRTRIAGQMNTGGEPKRYQMLLTVKPKSQDDDLDRIFTAESTKNSLFFKFPIAVGQVLAADGMPVE